MNIFNKPLYVPALRMKFGELQGIRALADDVAAHVWPRIVVPPPEERDETMQLALFSDAHIPAVGPILSRHWRDRRLFLDPSYLIDDVGADTIDGWFPEMFERTRKASVLATPLLPLRELIRVPTNTIKAALSTEDAPMLGIVISSADLVDRQGINKVLSLISELEITPADCSIVADFHDADFTNAEFVTPVIEGAFDLLQEAAVWKHVIFQGTHYPEKNPADPGSNYLVPRNEWKAWRDAVRFSPTTADNLIFGDYGADCAKMSFGKANAAAIRHYRYTTTENWLVERGGNEGTDREIMSSVCQKIVSSGHFSGRAFSSADDFIFRTAYDGAGPGNATTWRAINTTHHITRVVADIGEVRGLQIAPRTVSAIQVQSTLF